MAKAFRVSVIVLAFLGAIVVIGAIANSTAPRQVAPQVVYLQVPAPAPVQVVVTQPAPQPVVQEQSTPTAEFIQPSVQQGYITSPPVDDQYRPRQSRVGVGTGIAVGVILGAAIVSRHQPLFGRSPNSWGGGGRNVGSRSVAIPRSGGRRR